MPLMHQNTLAYMRLRVQRQYLRHIFAFRACFGIGNMYKILLPGTTSAAPAVNSRRHVIYASGWNIFLSSYLIPSHPPCGAACTDKRTKQSVLLANVLPFFGTSRFPENLES